MTPAIQSALFRDVAAREARGATPRQTAGHYEKWLNWANALEQPPARLRGGCARVRKPRPGALTARKDAVWAEGFAEGAPGVRPGHHQAASCGLRRCRELGLREFVWVAASLPWRMWWVSPPGDAGVYTDRRNWPLGAVLGHLCTLLRRCGQVRRRKSVHRSAKTASRSRFGALVYTVATRALRCELRRVVRAPQPPWRAGGAPLLVASLLVGKTGSARVAPPLGWHLRRGSNPHKSPMGLGAQGYTKDERAVHRAKAPSLRICSPDGPVTLLLFKVGRDRPDSGVESR